MSDLDARGVAAASGQPHPIDLLVIHGVVISVDAQRRIWVDGAVAVDRGRIVAVGRTREIEAEYVARQVIDARGGAVTPGFIDGHTHISQHLGRGSIPDTWPEEREHDQHIPYLQNLTPEDVRASSMLACLEMVRNGTTTFSDLAGPLDVEIRAAAVEAVGLRASLSETARDVPPKPELAIGDTDFCLRKLERVLKVLPFRGPETRVWGGVGLPGMGTASDRLIVEAKGLANQHGLVFYMHQSFGEQDTVRHRERTGGLSASAHLDRLGVLDDRLQLIHMIRTDESEVPLLARAGTHIVHCPAASTRVGMGVSRIGCFPEMVDAGVNVALGSDSGNYSDFYDIGRQMYLAATIHREARGVMPTLTAEQAIEMATRNGARAMGMGDHLGSLEPGKQADLVIHRWDRPEWRPGVDPVNSFVYSAQSVGVDTVIVGGETILERGRFTRVDEEAELQAIDRAARDLNRRSGYRVEQRWPVLA